MPDLPAETGTDAEPSTAESPQRPPPAAPPAPPATGQDRPPPAQPPRPPSEYRPDLRPMLILFALLVGVIVGWLVLSPMILPGR
ncbi:MAG TPA: LapA family protein [Candidatus Limnocylindrales bacterium]|nr:LapA family protein [Candidatus Limnocylindrales bacterium]